MLGAFEEALLCCFEAQSSDLMRSPAGLAYICLLYDVEREARERNIQREARRELCQRQSKPILDDLHTYLEREQSQVLPKSPEGQVLASTSEITVGASVTACYLGPFEV